MANKNPFAGKSLGELQQMRQRLVDSDAQSQHNGQSGQQIRALDAAINGYKGASPAAAPPPRPAPVAAPPPQQAYVPPPQTAAAVIAAPPPTPTAVLPPVIDVPPPPITGAATITAPTVTSPVGATATAETPPAAPSLGDASARVDAANTPATTATKTPFAQATNAIQDALLKRKKGFASTALTGERGVLGTLGGSRMAGLLG